MFSFFLTHIVCNGKQKVLFQSKISLSFYFISQFKAFKSQKSVAIKKKNFPFGPETGLPGAKIKKAKFDHNQF